MTFSFGRMFLRGMLQKSNVGRKENSSTVMPQKRLHMMSSSRRSKGRLSMSTSIASTTLPSEAVKWMSQSVMASMRLPMASVTVPSISTSSYRS